MGPRDALNKLRWHPEHELKGAKITIVHRGAPRDILTLDGEDILEIKSGFMRVKREQKTIEVPFHRIKEIKTTDGIIWKESD